MQTTAACIGIGIIYRIGGIDIITAGIRVAHIGKWQDTEAHANMLEYPETGYGILEIGILGILTHTVLTEVGNLSTQSHIKDKRQRIDRRITGGIDDVHLITLAETHAEAIHTTVEAAGLLAEDS